MEKIRLGNDIEMRWSIFTRDGDNKVPYDLEGRALTLSVVNRKGESEIEFFAEGNIVTGIFRGRDQKILGKHGVILRENNGADGMRTVDACDAFELVACSCEEALGSPGTIQLFHLTFDTTVGAITGTIDPILNYEAEQAEAERKANEIVRKSNEEQRIENENQRNADETLRKIAEEARAVAEQERQAGEDLREANEAARIASEDARSSAEAIRAADEAARTEAETARADAEAARVEAEDARAEAEAARVEAEKLRVEAEAERQAKFAAALVQETGQDTGKVMSQKAVTDALEGKQEKLVAGDNITIVGNVISSTGGGPGGSIDLSSYAKKEDVDAALEGKQDTISDLDAIRQGAQKGSTALQSESDPVYLADKPKLALKVEIPDVSGKVDKVTGKGLSSNDYTDADKLKLAGLKNYDDTQIRELIAGKANLQHQHTVADITDFPELYYDATEILSSATFTIEQFDELYDAILSKKIIYTYNYNNDGSYLVFQPFTWFEFSSKVIELTAACREGNKSVLTSFILYPYEGNDVRKFKAYVPANTSELLNDSGFITDSDITGKADKATTLAGYGISNAYTKSEVDTALAGKANLQHQHTVADITDFPELYYDATAFFTSGAYPSDKYEELLEAVKAKKTVYATLDEEGNISYVFFTSLANSDGSSSRVLLTTIFADGGFLYLNTFVLQQSGMTRMQENITSKADKATTLAGYGIGDAYTKSEVDAAISSAITTTLNTEV